MKKLFSVMAVLSMMISCTSCGLLYSAYETDEELTVPTEEIPVTETVISAEVATEQLEKADPTRQKCRKTIKNSEKPEVVKVYFEGLCSEDIRKHAQVKDLYNIDMLHSGVVGLVGIPIEIEYDSEISQPRLGLEYDTSELRGIPEKNLIMLHYSEEDEFYNTVEDFELDTDKCIVSADIDESGVYLLADAYQWYDCWGIDVSEYAYERDLTQYKTDWEREEDMGSIMALANKEWAMENAPDFHVSTAEQLASVVWYVNGIDGNADITLEKDIDLSDYQWKPMGWGKGFGNGFSGTVDGQGHTIYGMTIIENYLQSGFIGYGTGVSVKNINFEDAYVSATHCTGIAGGELGTTVGALTCRNMPTKGI